jgi:hypothetical protein
MPPIFLCYSVTSEPDVGGVVVKVEPSHQCTVSFVVVRQIVTAEQSTKMTSDIEVRKKQMCY